MIKIFLTIFVLSYIIIVGYHQTERMLKMSAFEVNFYYKADGSCPVRDFLDTLDNKMLAKLLGTISLLETNGTQLREPYSKSLGDGIFELRAKQSSNITRILYFFVVGHQIILTNGFVKKTQKTPPEEIALAQKYRADYFYRKESSS